VIFSKINCKREGLDNCEKIREAGSTDQKHESGRPKHVGTEENVTVVDELVGLLSWEGQTQAHRSTRQIFRETSCAKSIVSYRSFTKDASLKCLFR